MELTFSLPFCILLPDGNYPVKLEEADNGMVNLQLEKIIPKIFDERLPFRALTDDDLKDAKKIRLRRLSDGLSEEIDVSLLPSVHDFRYVMYIINKNNEKIYTQSPLVSQQVIINGEIPIDRFGRLRYTRVTYESSKNLQYGAEFKRALVALNKMIDTLRIMDPWLHRLRESDIFEYRTVPKGGGWSGSSRIPEKFKEDYEEDTIDMIKNLLMTNERIPAYNMLLADSFSAYYESYFHLSVIYSITALESAVRSYIERKSIERENHDKVTKWLVSLPISKLIETTLYLFLGEQEYPHILARGIKKDIELRNLAIHQSKLDISKEEAKRVLHNLMELLNILTPKSKNNTI